VGPNFGKGGAQNSGRLFSHLDLVPFVFLQLMFMFFNPSNIFIQYCSGYSYSGFGK
jgi:hypothetical protein